MITYITIKTEHLDGIDFSQIIETNKDSVRKSNDGSEFVAKWEGVVPSSIVAIPDVDKSKSMTHAEALVLMDSPEWSVPMPI